MNAFKNWTMGLAAFALTAAGALAGDWHNCGEYRTGGGAKEVPARYQNVRRVEVRCIEGGVNIQTLWVRNGGQKKENRVARSLARGDSHVIELGGQDVTGFRISDGGNGRYRVSVLTDDPRGERPSRRDRQERDRYDDDRYERHCDDRYDRYDDDRYDDDRHDDWHGRRRDRRPPPPHRHRDGGDETPWWWPW